MKERVLRMTAWVVFHVADRIARQWHIYSARLQKAAMQERGRNQARKIIREGRVIPAGS